MEKNQQISLSEQEKDRIQAMLMLVKAIRNVSINHPCRASVPTDLYWFLVGYTEGVIEKMMDETPPSPEHTGWVEYLDYRLEKIYQAFGYVPK